MHLLRHTRMSSFPHEGHSLEGTIDAYIKPFDPRWAVHGPSGILWEKGGKPGARASFMGL